MYGQDAQIGGNQFSYRDNEDGKVSCGTLELGGYDDWRLETLDDLNQDGIVDRADLLLLKRFVRQQLTGM
ncbi:hypothetical protein LA52FAK_25110 [Desulforhopalus sp. 52FAK]